MLSSLASGRIIVTFFAVTLLPLFTRNPFATFSMVVVPVNSTVLSGSVVVTPVPVSSPFIFKSSLVILPPVFARIPSTAFSMVVVPFNVISLPRSVDVTPVFSDSGAVTFISLPMIFPLFVALIAS